jgi:hypothetical protein
MKYFPNFEEKIYSTNSNPGKYVALESCSNGMQSNRALTKTLFGTFSTSNVLAT